MPHIPQHNGRWADPQIPGNSVWFPDMECVPNSANDPLHPRKWKRLVMAHFFRPVTLRGISAIRAATLKINLLLLAQGVIGVRFRNNEPDFAPFALATVRVDSFMDTRYGSEGTMHAADKALARRLGITEGEVRQWINDNQYVWHERQDGRRIDLLCHDIHGNIPHSGGIAANKAR